MTNEGHTIYYSGREKHQEGVGFIVKGTDKCTTKLYYHIQPSNFNTIKSSSINITITIIRPYIYI